VLRLESPPLDPSPQALSRHIALDPVPPSVAVARSFLRQVLAEADGDADRRDSALLLASELVTNAILHARTAVQLGVVVDDGRVLVCVGDRLAGAGEITPRGHSQDRPGGRGLALVADLSDDWGTESYSGGKTVWFTMPVADRPVSVG
jgi:anti-sigma regulatory factor (Ser/Thr protein kinase)